jgi:hypothetical protein
VADLQGELVERRGDDCRRRQIFRVDVALNDLRRDGRGPEAETLTNFLFDHRVEVRERADRAAYLADGDGLARAH